jgi:hypothetical protein
VAADQFPAKIDSLDQLDDSVVQPIYVAALRFQLGEGGKNLPEWATGISSGLNPHVALTFEERLMRAGFLKQYSDRYGRKFKLLESTVRRVDTNFPRLTKGRVPSEVLSARYVIDLDRLAAPHQNIEIVLRTLGAI